MNYNESKKTVPESSGTYKSWNAHS